LQTASDDWLGLAGKIVVVTGAAGGIGQAIVRGFAAAGCILVLLERDPALCASLVTELEATGIRAISLAADVSSEASIRSAANEIASILGPVGILVNNAGILRPGSLEALSLDEWNLVLNVNLTGYFLCAQIFAEQMKEAGGGAMVHIGSVAGEFPQPHSGAYSVAKAGVHMLSRLIAVEMGPAGIRSNVISPAMVITPMSVRSYADPDLRRSREEMVPSRRIGMPEHMADAAVWLASDRAAYVNGIEVPVDGALPRNLLGFIPRPGFSA